VDAAGNLWEWLDDHYDLGKNNSAGWSTAIVDVGKDAAFARGQAYTYVYGASDDAYSWRCFFAGGTFSNSVLCGSRCLRSNARPWRAHGRVGLRCVCDAL
jgi:formylglycine-generating enzyme required for sulfatase activity